MPVRSESLPQGYLRRLLARKLTTKTAERKNSWTCHTCSGSCRCAETSPRRRPPPSKLHRRYCRGTVLDPINPVNHNIALFLSSWCGRFSAPVAVVPKVGGPPDSLSVFVFVERVWDIESCCQHHITMTKYRRAFWLQTRARKPNPCRAFHRSYLLLARIFCCYCTSKHTAKVRFDVWSPICS